MVRLIITTLTFLSLFGCSTQDGDWAPMKWKTEQSLLADKGVFIIPSEGVTVTFECRNYHSPWISFAHTDEVDINPDIENVHDIRGEWFSASMRGNLLQITFTDNTDEARSITLEVTAGDIFYTFRFKQLGKKE